MPPKMTLLTASRCLVVLSATSGLFLSGCMAVPVIPTLAASGLLKLPGFVNANKECYYPQCSEPLLEMQRRDETLMKQTVESAMGGGLGGAVVGIVAAGDVTGALIGMGIGVLSGGIIGYTFAKMDQVEDENTRFASIRLTANQDLSKANRLQLYSYESMTCYMRVFDKLQESYAAGSLSKEEYANRFKEIRDAMVELGKVIGNMDENIRRTEREFNASFSKSVPVAPVAPVDAPVAQPDSPKKQTAATRKPARKKRAQQSEEIREQSASERIADTLAKNKKRVEATQAKNDDDLAVIQQDFAGKETPPPQNVKLIKTQYGQGYKTTRQQMDELRDVHREALNIMDSAALEAGIDMV